MSTISLSTLRTFGVSLVRALGVPDERAEVVAGYGLTAAALGSQTHGLQQWIALSSLIPDSVDPRREARSQRQAAGNVWFDGQGVMGQWALHTAAGQAAAEAREQGSCLAVVANTHWIGALGPYLLPLARGGLMAQLWAQNSQCQDSAPFGGIEPRLSTNPIAMAFPVGDGPDDLVLADFSTSTMAMGKVNQLINQQRQADYPAFIAPDGRPSTDPNVMRQGGSIALLGGDNDGYKGFAFSLWCEAITALAGGKTNDPASPQRQTLALLVLDPRHFAGRDAYVKEMKRLVTHLHTSRLRPGFKELRLPGQRALASLRAAERDGLAVPDAMRPKLAELAGKAGVTCPW